MNMRIKTAESKWFIQDAVTNVQISSKLQAGDVQAVTMVIYYYDARTNGMTSYINPKRVLYASFENNLHIVADFYFSGKLYVALRTIWNHIKFSFIEKSKKKLL
jgi:hypothetical protein